MMSEQQELHDDHIVLKALMVQIQKPDCLTHYVYSHNRDMQLLFLSRVPSQDIPSEDKNLIVPGNVYLYLHLLTNGVTSEISSAIRLLGFSKKEFTQKIISKNCLLTSETFNDNSIKDHSSNLWVINRKGKVVFSHNHCKRYTELNSFFHNLYRNLDLDPYKTFLIAYAYFFLGVQKYSLFEMKYIFNTYIQQAKPDMELETNEKFQIVHYITKLYSQYSSSDLYRRMKQLLFFTERFNSNTHMLYGTLKTISKTYTHDESAGVVCSYALTKSFQNVPAETYLKRFSMCKNDIIRQFQSVIHYYNKERYDDMTRDIEAGLQFSNRSGESITRYILKKQSNNLFLNTTMVKRLREILTQSLLKFFGTLPPPQMELQPTLALCELMSGACTSDGHFGSENILQMKPFKPILKRWKGNEHTVAMLSGLNIDSPMPKHVEDSLKRHFIRPSISTYVHYCSQLLNHVRVHQYYYHEVINPFLPIYTIDADVDIHDKEFVHSYYLGEQQWKSKETLFNSLVMLVKIVCNEVLKLKPPIDDANTTFFMYESIHDDLENINSVKFKLGIRFVMKFTSIVFKNSSVVNAFLKILEMFRGKIPFLAEITDEEIFDSAIYGQPAHSIRLPLNMNSDSSKALLPVFFKNQQKIAHVALKISSCFVHLRNTADCGDTVQYLENLVVPSEQILSKANTDNVIKDMFIAKSNSTIDYKPNISMDEIVFTENEKQQLIEGIDLFSEGRLRKRENAMNLKCFQESPIVFLGQTKYKWVQGIKFCAITDHENPNGNPCNYFLKTRKHEDNKTFCCFLFCNCYSTNCQNVVPTRCIWKIEIKRLS